MKFSIITPVYNGADYIDELILSVKNQKYQGDIEHIVINDGSTDDGASQNIIDKYPHLITLSRANIGQYATINEGLNIATGDFVVVISADDLFASDSVFENVYAAFKENENIDIIYGRSSRITELGYPVGYDGIVIKEPFAKWRFKYQLPLLHCSAFIRKSFLISNNLYFDNLNFKYAADWDLFLRMSKLTEFKFIDIVISKYRIHSKQTTNMAERKVLKAEDILVLKKNNSSIVFYYLLLNFERLRKGIMLFKNRGLKFLCAKIVDFYKRV